MVDVCFLIVLPLCSSPPTLNQGWSSVTNRMQQKWSCMTTMARSEKSLKLLPWSLGSLPLGTLSHCVLIYSEAMIPKKPSVRPHITAAANNPDITERQSSGWALPKCKIYEQDKDVFKSLDLGVICYTHTDNWNGDFVPEASVRKEEKTFCTMWPISFCKHQVLAVSTKKRCTTWELWVKFYLGQNEDCSLGGSLSDSSERLLQSGSRGESIYKVLVKGEFNTMKHSFYKRFFVSHEGLMSPWRDLVLL